MFSANFSNSGIQVESKWVVLFLKWLIKYGKSKMNIKIHNTSKHFINNLEI